jgi:hypothetical protein
VVLHLDPVLRPPRLIGPITALRDQALQAKFASLAEKVTAEFARKRALEGFLKALALKKL